MESTTCLYCFVISALIVLSIIDFELIQLIYGLIFYLLMGAVKLIIEIIKAIIFL